ncbi:PglZ domain protein [Sporomusa ovata DSM 2662]|uniref:Uncharacterized protein n=1 Tax=Sporomusa ovata TaxID=2378 RepID=A0A0U1KZ13_9FIRM|nr:BREX-3 system phosphatase PglZ [Sporomusa ovata]EQB29181.1 PglZ domain containing protein [Sporomusa ovata DSM 2662]CQR72616.1 conserved hypothetical protein VrlP [Sporomusa ovata]
MTNWRDPILKEFIPQVAPLTIVADPDGLLLEEGVLAGIRERGFELIPFEDPVEFRFAYESIFRSRWDQGEYLDLVLTLSCTDSELEALPYDLIQVGRKIAFHLADSFPNLSYPVLKLLDRGDLDILYEAHQRYTSERLGDNATKDFVLRHVFELAPEMIKQPADMLRILLRRHFRGLHIPLSFDERFMHLLRQNEMFDEWPLEIILRDRTAFFLFLQERWSKFLDRASSRGIKEETNSYSLTIPGPVDIPFDHQDVRVYMDNLFAEGLLHAVAHSNFAGLATTWMNIGIQTDPFGDRTKRINKLMATLQSSLPSESSRYGDWIRFAQGWAELLLLVNEQPDDIFERSDKCLKDLQLHLDASFTGWLSHRYSGLINLPPLPPVMLHHVPRLISRQLLGDSKVKIALIVVDGLAMDQWLVLRDVIKEKQPEFEFNEQAVFAWIPSLTSISRQAIFAGKAPFFFPNSIQTTDKEAVLWTQFWADQGLVPHEVLYRKGLGDRGLEDLEEELSHPKLRVAGLIVDKVDKIMHGMEMGTAGMHNQVRQWGRQGVLLKLFELLLDKGFMVYLTSDHGNIEASGCGRPIEGAIADLRGERVRIYSDPMLRSQIRQKFPATQEWEPIGLPSSCLALIAPSRQAFINEGQHIVSHGGISIEEIIVPLIHIRRREKWVSLDTRK